VLKPDGDYGPKTVAVVRAAQEQCGVTGPDAVGTPVGPRTKAAFWARGWRG
jgi:peptidoglycan hydrolase-like protein with peptidoglycan-binding domain